MFGVIEGTGFGVIEPEFEACFVGHARVERLWTGARWSEGPAWHAADRFSSRSAGRPGERLVADVANTCHRRGMGIP
mgnify:CR=1 FL=1